MPTAKIAFASFELHRPLQSGHGHVGAPSWDGSASCSFSMVVAGATNVVVERAGLISLPSVSRLSFLGILQGRGDRATSAARPTRDTDCRTTSSQPGGCRRAVFLPH